jgi:mannose-6-phosphate isomerase-like protein (cupin superfamily)
MNPINIKSAEHYLWGEGCDGWHLVKREGVSVIQERVPPGRAELKHLHHQARQFFFILEGQATIEIGETVVVLNPHEGIEVAPDLPHRFRNDSDREVSFLVISVPPSHGDRENLAPSVPPLA